MYPGPDGSYVEGSNNGPEEQIDSEEFAIIPFGDAGDEGDDQQLATSNTSGQAAPQLPMPPMPADMSQRMLPLLSDWKALLTSNITQVLQQALRVLALKAVELTGMEQRAKTAEQRYQALCKAVCLLVNDINDRSHVITAHRH